MAALTAFTVVQRVWHVRNELRAGEPGVAAPVSPAKETADV
jgi:hypothetical protein